MSRICHSVSSLAPVLLALCLAASPAAGGEPVALGDLSLEDLMQYEVTSVSKKPQRLANVAAAVHVISAEDIRLSGANSIPEALRLAPGIDATRVSGNRWSVSARGSTDLFANKLLVMVDGRNAFNPAFSGVVWQDFLFPIEDIERIEVIRGPAAAVWGSNGVNGVINIITRSAASTPGTQIVAGAGKTEGEFARARWGGSSGDLYYRTYVSTQRASSQQAIESLGGGNGNDAYGHNAVGLRLDGYLSNGARWDMSADFYENRGDGTAYFAAATGLSLRQFKEKHRGITLRARYEKSLADGGNLQLQGGYVHSTLQIPYMLTDQRDTLDLDMQHRIRLGEVHDVIWGINGRLSQDTDTATAAMSLNTPSRRLSYYGLSAQDEIRVKDTVHLTLGMRLDHSEMTGWATQPTARLSWNLQPSHTLWGSLSKASRAPSRGERGFNFNQNYIAGAPVPNTLVVLHGDENFGNERLKAAEIGLRSQWAPSLSTDAVVFDHRYDNLRSAGAPTIDASGFPLIISNIPIINGDKAQLTGLELSADWRISSAWRMQWAQTWNNPIRIDTSAVDISGQIPRQLSSLRVFWSPTATINVDAWLRRTAERPAPLNPDLMRNAFSSIDLRVAWRPKKDMELSLTGQNLQDRQCAAYSGRTFVRENINIVPTCQPRNLVAQARVEF